MTSQELYNELLKDGIMKEFLDYMVDLGMSLPISKRYLDELMGDDDEQ